MKVAFSSMSPVGPCSIQEDGAHIVGQVGMGMWGRNDGTRCIETTLP